MNTIRYSVIIPARNAEGTLPRCLDSLLAQNREDAEIILVSDGSYDQTDAIGKSYGERIRFVRQAHGGVSAARNRGLDLAAGEFVTFVDSDDFVSPDYFAALDREPDRDFLVFGAGDCAGGDVLRRLLATRKIMPPWNKRIRRSLIEDNRLRFIEGVQVGEDFCFCLACALAAKTIGVSSADIYHMDISNENSLSRGYRPDLDEIMERVFHHTVNLPGAEKYADTLDYLFVKNVFTCIAEEYKRASPSRQRVEEICHRFRRPIGSPSGAVHWVLRRLLNGSVLPIWAVAYLGKGRKFAKCRRKKC